MYRDNAGETQVPKPKSGDSVLKSIVPRHSGRSTTTRANTDRKFSLHPRRSGPDQRRSAGRLPRPKSLSAKCAQPPSASCWSIAGMPAAIGGVPNLEGIGSGKDQKFAMAVKMMNFSIPKICPSLC